MFRSPRPSYMILKESGRGPHGESHEGRRPAVLVIRSSHGSANPSRCVRGRGERAQLISSRLISGRRKTKETGQRNAIPSCGACERVRLCACACVRVYVVVRHLSAGFPRLGSPVEQLKALLPRETPKCPIHPVVQPPRHAAMYRKKDPARARLGGRGRRASSPDFGRARALCPTPVPSPPRPASNRRSPCLVAAEAAAMMI